MSKVYGVLPAESIPAPDAPAQFRIESRTARYVSLSWGGPVEETGGPATSWQVYRDGLALGAVVTLPEYTDSTVVPETTYAYQFQAFNAGGASVLSQTFDVTTPANTAPVWSLVDQTATLGASYSLDLTTASTDADGHTLSFSITAGAVPGLSVIGSALSGTPTTAGVFSLTLDAYDGYAHAAVTVSFTVIDTDNTAPSVPTGVIAVANGSTVTVTWTASTDPSGISAYRVRRDDVFRGSVLGDVLEYTESGVPDGTYTYAVRAVDASANLNTSASSVGATVTVQVTSPVPDVPISLAVATVSSSRLDVSWAAGPNGATPTGYRLQRANTLAGTYSTVYEGASTSFSDTGLPAAATRYYKVLAKNGANESAYSTPVAGTTQNTPDGAADFVIPESTAARTITNNVPASGLAIAYNSVTWLSLATGGKTRPTAGDIIELANGTHGQITFTLNGTSAGDIEVRTRGATRTTISSTADYPLLLLNCNYLTINGRDLGSQYGLYVTSPGAASTSLIKVQGFCTFLTIKNFELDGKRTTFVSAVTPIGLSLHDNNAKADGTRYQEGRVVYNFYAHNLGGEGIYCGSNYTNGAAPMKSIEIYNGLIEDTGRDGIQGKQWWAGSNSIHDNVLRRVGRNSSDQQGQRPGIDITSGKGVVYNNLVIDAGEVGIRFTAQDGPLVGKAATFLGYPSFSTFPCEAYNNVVVNAGVAGGNSATGHGFNVNNVTNGAVYPVASVYNNTVIYCEGSGISFTSNVVGGIAQNNILLENASPTSNGSGATVDNNYSTGLAASVLVNPSAENYRLQSEKAVTAGLTSATDINGDSRAGTASKGAYEYS